MTRKIRSIAGAWAAALGLVLAPTAAQAEVPGTLALQGRLSNVAGFAVPDGDYGLTLRFYAKSSDTKAVWTYVDPGVKVAKGIFTVAVGDKMPLEKKEFLNGNAGYVSIQVGSDAELGKLALHPVAYALRAEVAVAAKALECTGCLTADHLDPAVLAPYAKTSALAKLAQSGNWVDVSDKPKLVLVDQKCGAGDVVGGVDATGQVICAKNPSYTGADFAVANQGCGVGNVVTGVDAAGKVTCAKDGSNSYDGSSFAVSGQACAPGQMVTGVGADGKVSCAVDKDTVTTYNGKDFAVSSQGCPSGQIVSGIDGAGKVQCVADKDTATIYTGKDFAVSGQSCPPGQVIYAIDGTGKVQCAADKDTITTYGGKDFALSNQACPGGQVVVGVNANGAVTCGADKDTTYGGNTFATSNQACASGSVVTGIAANGAVSCAPDKDTNTTYSGANFATSSQGCPGGQVVTGINGSGAVTCAADKDTAYSGANFATSSQGCLGGQVVTGINGSGAVTCAADKDTTYGGGNFATSNQACPAGQIVTGVNTSGAVTCAVEKAGMTFTRWGRSDCPSGSSVVYSGYQAGKHYTHGGGGTNTLCLTNSPTWLNYNDANQNGALIYGTEYEMSGYGLVGVTPFNSLNDYNAPCAVCLNTSFSTHLLVPGTYQCPSGWTSMYHGYLMSTHYNQGASEFTCIDVSASAIGSNADHNGNLLYPTEAECGSLPCGPYVQDRELTCVVCGR